MNLKGSSFIAKDTTGLTVTENIKVESAVNSYENESKSIRWNIRLQQC